MIRVNGKDLAIYNLDTNQSIISRIAARMNTLPKYLYGVPENILESKEIKVRDILGAIKKNASESTDFNEFLEKIKPYLSPKIDIKTDVLYVWLLNNAPLKEMEKFGGITAVIDASESFLEEPNEYFPSKNAFETFWRSQRESIGRNIDRMIRNNQILSQKDTELYEMFQQIGDEDAWGFTTYKTTKVTLNITLDVKDITLLEIFNNIVLFEAAPFAKCKNYYKILKDYIPPEEWSDFAEENAILIKINEKQVVESKKHKDYTNVIIKLEGDIGDEVVTADVTLVTERGFLSREQFIERLEKIWSPKVKLSIKNIDETHVFGNFYFPQKRLNTYVFSDLVMNNHVFAKLINIDESDKVTKKKLESGQPWLHIHFNHPVTGDISASITQKVVDRGDPLMRVESEEIFPHGEPYIRIRTKGRDRHSVEFFQEMLSKLLVLYDQNYEDIVHDYEIFLPDFGEVKELVAPVRKKNVDAELFVHNYSRFCPDTRALTVINKDDVDEYKDKGLQVMKFPRDVKEDDPAYRKDQKQNYYVCLNPEYPYPGIQENNLENSKIYPYVPCCFKTNQDKEGGIYRHYFYGEEKKVKEKKQQELIVTDKILEEREQFGKLPDQLLKIFGTLDNDPTFTYIRVGAGGRHQSSFLNVIMVALYEFTGILNTESLSEQIAILEQTRQDLASENLCTMARQNAYDMTIQELMTNIRDPTVYFDPKIYVQLLEGFLNCNIYLFNKTQMFLPRYTQSYYKTHRPDSPCIFVYEHWGSESDHAEYPQCELICRWNPKESKNTQYSFPYNQKISMNINKVFRLLNESYALDKKIAETVFPIVDDAKMISQKIDNYGKTRCINFMFNGVTVSILTTPMPPLALMEDRDTEIMSVNAQVAIDLLTFLQAEITSQTISNQVLKEINGKLGNVLLAIPVEDQAPLEDIPTSNIGMHYSDNNSSSLQLYNYNKKMARYLTEYMFWLFSTYIQNNNVEEVTDKVLAKFARESLQIIPNFKYQNVLKNFSMKGAVMKNNKLVVTSEDMLKRLMYILKLYSIRDWKTLRTYYARKSITHYYVDLTDFDYYPDQIILQGEDSIDKWIQESKFIYKLQREIIVGQQSPYFFRNDLIGDEIFLAQNATTLEQAMYIAVTWQKEGYNPKNTEKSDIMYSFTLYLYVNGDNITKQQVKGAKNANKEIKILGYRLSGIPFYTVLLNLD